MLVCKRCANDLCGVGKPVMVADTRNCRMGAGLTRCEASQVQDKKSSVRVPECWPSACESDMSKKSYRELAVQRCSNILPWWWDHRLKFPALSDLARNRFWVMRINGASERVVWTARHVVNSRRVNLKSSSVNNILFFNGASKLRTKCSRLTKRYHIFTLQCFSWASVGFEGIYWNSE